MTAGGRRGADSGDFRAESSQTVASPPTAPLERQVLGDGAMVRLNVALGAASQRYAQNLLEAFRFLMMSTRHDAGCVECSVWLDAESTVRYTEVWSTEADMRRRVRSDHFTTLLSVVESATEVQVQFDFVTATRGLDYVAEVREDVANGS